VFEARHEQFRQILREFVEREVNPQADQWEQQERIPKSLFPHGAAESDGGVGIDCRMGPSVVATANRCTRPVGSTSKALRAVFFPDGHRLLGFDLRAS
jgi:hypothetical protein